MTFSAAIITLIWITIAALSVSGAIKRKYPSLYIAQSIVAQFCSLFTLLTLNPLFWAVLAWQVIVSIVAMLAVPKMRYVPNEERDVTMTEAIIGFALVILLDILFWFGMVWALS